jgi:hypothetical protein
MSKKEKIKELVDDSVSLQEDKYRRYREEMNDLKTMFFTEIRVSSNNSFL